MQQFLFFLIHTKNNDNTHAHTHTQIIRIK